MEERDTREIVEVYRQPGPREVVEVYSRPLPGTEPPGPKSPAKRKSRKGLWLFLACLAVVVLLAVAGRLLTDRLAPSDDDQFEK